MPRRIRVAFVDDEAKILTSMRRTMLSMLDEWEMGFFAGGPELLDAMAKEGFDVVVSDMRMPGMDGAMLLEAISKQYPDTVRVILSGYADPDSIFRTLGPAHIYLAKPCDPALLRQAIRGRLILRNRLGGQNLRGLLGGISALPSAPQLFSQLLELLRSPKVSAAAVADIIGGDVAMTAELLKLTNSSYFAVNATVTSPLQAVRLLGLEMVQTLVLQLGIFRQFMGNELVRQQIDALNLYSHGIGILAERIMVSLGESEKIAKAAYCTALLSTIGSLILLHEKGADYQAILAEIGPEKPLSKAESDRFGADHGLIGAYLLSLWGFADPVVEAITFAAAPSQCDNPANPLLTALHVARALGPAFPLLPKADAPPHALDQTYLGTLGRQHQIGEWQELATNTQRALSHG